jgi:hypothetical protein
MTTLVIIDTKSGRMARYENRRRTHRVAPNDPAAHPLSAAYVPLINELRVHPEKFFPTGPQEAA